MQQAIFIVPLLLLLGACRSDYDNYIKDMRRHAFDIGDQSTWRRGEALHDTLHELLVRGHGDTIHGTELDSVLANAVLMEDLRNWYDKVRPLGVGWDMMRQHARRCLRTRWCNDPPIDGPRRGSSLRTDMDTAAVMSYLWRRFREKDRTVVNKRDLVEPGRLLRGMLVADMRYHLRADTDSLGVPGFLIEGELDVKDEGEASHDGHKNQGHVHDGYRAMKAKWERMGNIRELAQLGSFDLDHLRPQESERTRKTIDSTLAKVYGVQYTWAQGHLPFRTLYGCGLEVSVHVYSKPSREPGYTCHKQMIRVLRLVGSRLHE